MKLVYFANLLRRCYRLIVEAAKEVKKERCIFLNIILDMRRENRVQDQGPNETLRTTWKDGDL